MSWCFIKSYFGKVQKKTIQLMHFLLELPLPKLFFCISWKNKTQLFELQIYCKGIYGNANFTAFRCAYCRSLNPARKERPTAPKLECDSPQPARKSLSTTGTNFKKQVIILRFYKIRREVHSEKLLKHLF